MSRPRPVDAPLEIPRSTAEPLSKPPPASSIHNTASSSTTSTDTSSRTPSAVCESTFSMRASTAASTSPVGNATGTGSVVMSRLNCRFYSMASGYQKSVRSAATTARSHHSSSSLRTGLRASLMTKSVVRCNSSRSARSRSFWAPSSRPSTEGRAAVRGVRSRCSTWLRSRNWAGRGISITRGLRRWKCPSSASVTIAKSISRRSSKTESWRSPSQRIDPG